MDLLKSKRFELAALCVVAIVVAAFMRWAGPAAAAQPQKRTSVAADIEIDRACGLLERPWTFDYVRFNAPLISPRQMSIGFPPYGQQPEKAQSFILTPQGCVGPPALCH